ncbi:Ig domain-containing protein [Methanosarcina barkeri]|nr:Ig domain-containing protein [Methanosarcina barkeri]
MCFMLMTTGITSASVDHPPVLNPIGSKTVYEGKTLSFTPTAKDPDGDKVTYSATGLPRGARLVASTGKFTWKPATGQKGNYIVTFSAKAKGLKDSEKVKITVLAENPKIKITSVSRYGTAGYASGTVKGVSTSAYRVAVFIYVPNLGWWNKPTWAHPLKTINCNGKWKCDIDTGGRDVYATKVAAFLVPKNYKPPELHGSSSLPSELYKKAVAHHEVSR